MATATLPLVVALICGKRKSGKDFVAEALSDTLGPSAAIFRISAPLKKAYATLNGLDLDQLMSDTIYKETYRRSMIEWSEKMRQNDPGYFCRLTTQDAGHLFPVLIIPDIRRQTDVSYFRERHNCVLVRVSATQSTREARGFVFCVGVDDSESECGLDGVVPDFTLQNDATVPLQEVAGYRELMAQLKKHIS